MSPIVGIDLGTTNSLIGVMEAGFPILLAGSDGERLTPSVVHFPSQGEPVVGHAALRMRVLDPAATVYSAKRFIGRRVGEETAPTGFALTGAAGTPVRFEVRGKPYPPEAISAKVLAKLRADAERALQCEVTRAVITVPAYFNDAQRNATKAAGELAGFTVERIVNEPTAAALAYGLNHLRDHSRVAVFDLGGGTFDISILELHGGVFQVLATHGDTRLGGDDIDEALVGLLSEKLEALAQSHGQEPGQSSQPTIRARLREAAVDAKHRLSSETVCSVELPFLLGNESLVYRLERSELERLARPILERTRAHCIRVLADARLGAADLDEVILLSLIHI